MSLPVARGDGIDVSIDMTDLRSTLKRNAPELEKEMRTSFKKLVGEAKRTVQSNTPVRTGALKRSISGRTSFTQTKTRMWITSNNSSARNYAWIQEYGRQKYRPMPGKHYIEKARDQVVPHALQEMNRIIKQTFKDMQ